jgi:hypothetical protein
MIRYNQIQRNVFNSDIVKTEVYNRQSKRTNSIIDVHGRQGVKWFCPGSCPISDGRLRFCRCPSSKDVSLSVSCLRSLNVIEYLLDDDECCHQVIKKIQTGNSY